MKRALTAITLIAATATPALANPALDGTVISTRGEDNIVALHPKESAIGDKGLVAAQDGMSMRLSAERILQEREQARVDGQYVTGYTFPSEETAVTQYGAR
ncbi:hypothetical protein [Lutimaribacter saemankumensis]|uniref:Uncharacterized protein n=1 Tax=Lutimaribacter saemankumensis TaxID=490829 RepID=A0A1G8QWH8_9RHOB|nr:hypothetical protein [Lutimaribacter saemankumensis]SDJ08675.1 hypothetical protein SAMN05421850_108112 [Lutimaribacter saemankumensis]